jgi:hypothetical protein
MQSIIARLIGDTNPLRIYLILGSLMAFGGLSLVLLRGSLFGFLSLICSFLVFTVASVRMQRLQRDQVLPDQ